MERLTFEGNFCDIAMCQENPCPYNGSCSQKKTWTRLKAYEDTELTPEICAAYKKFEDEAISKGVTFNRIVELMEAEKDGRLVVLPCSPGAELARDGRTFMADHWNVSLSAFREEPSNRSGRQVAVFSTEEAEAALEGGTNHAE